MTDDIDLQVRLGLGASFILFGVLCLMLPYKYNPFRLKAGFAKLFSEKIQKWIPKGLGIASIVFGLAIIFIP